MLRIGVFAWTLLIMVMVIALFNVKARVEQYNRDFLHISREIEAEQEKIEVLRAEWSYLGHPDRIAELARLHLGYDTSQRPMVGRLVDLPMRTVDRNNMTSVLQINIANQQMNRLGPQPNAEILELDSEIGGLRHIASPDLIDGIITHLNDE